MVVKKEIQGKKRNEIQGNQPKQNKKNKQKKTKEKKGVQSRVQNRNIIHNLGKSNRHAFIEFPTNLHQIAS